MIFSGIATSSEAELSRRRRRRAVPRTEVCASWNRGGRAEAELAVGDVVGGLEEVLGKV